MIKIIILDDHQLFIDGLINSFRNDKQIEIIDFALNGVNGLEKIIKNKPYMILLDIEFSKTRENGIDILKLLKQLKLPVKTLVLTNYCDKPLLEQLRKEGAEGYRVKNIGIDELRQTIVDIHNGEVIFKYDSGLIDQNIPVIPAKISERAIEIIKLLSEGLIVKEIASKLGIGETTVNDHIERTRKKMAAKNNTELVFLAVKNRLI